MPQRRHWRIAQQGGSFAVQGQIHVGIVVGQHDVVAQGPGHRLIQPVLAAGGGGGVVGEAEHHQPQAIPLAPGEPIEVGAPARLRIEGQKHGIGPRPDAVRPGGRGSRDRAAGPRRRDRAPPAAGGPCPPGSPPAAAPPARGPPPRRNGEAPRPPPPPGRAGWRHGGSRRRSRAATGPRRWPRGRRRGGWRSVEPRERSSSGGSGGPAAADAGRRPLAARRSCAGRCGRRRRCRAGDTLRDGHPGKP